MVTTKADTAGNKIGRAISSAAINKMTNMPMVAPCAAVRQTRDTSATGFGSLMPSLKSRRRAAWLSSELMRLNPLSKSR